MAGKCSSRGATDLYLEASPDNAKERWFVVNKKDQIESIQEICLTGNIPAWLEKASLNREEQFQSCQNNLAFETDLIELH